MRNAHLDSLLTAIVLLLVVSPDSGYSLLEGGIFLFTCDFLMDPILLVLGETNVLVTITTHGREQEGYPIAKLATDSVQCTLNSLKALLCI